MEEEKVQEGLTFGEIWHMVLRRIWYVLGAAALVTIIAVLVVYFAVNPVTRSYSMEFSLLFPTGSEYSYPDGEPFYYQEMVKESYLNKALETEGLAGIKIDRMMRHDDISVVAETVSENGETKYTGRYTIAAKSSYFSNAEQAETFIRAIANAVESDMREEAGKVDYAVSLETFNSASFEERLNLLAEERETLLEKYDEWIETYDAAYKLKVGETEKSLKELRASVNALYGGSVQKELENELKTGGYYFTDDFDAYKAALKAEYSRNKTEIGQLKDTGTAAQGASYVSYTGTISSYSAVSSQQKEDGDIVVEQPAPSVSQRLAALIERNANILHWLGSAYLGESGEPTAGTLTETTNTAFVGRIEAERVKLAGAAAELTAVTKAIYERGMQARFDVQKVETEGGVSVILIAVVAFVVSFLIACCVVCIVDRNRKRPAGQPASEAEAQPEAPEEKAPEEE